MLVKSTPVVSYLTYWTFQCKEKNSEIKVLSFYS
jgi:hypothetical protein